MNQNHIFKNEDDRSYLISDLGEVLLNIISPFNFIIEVYDFFKTHSLNFLPNNIINEIDSNLFDTKINTVLKTDVKCVYMQTELMINVLRKQNVP